MRLLNAPTLLTIAVLLASPSTRAQRFVYSGREYLKAGRSWAQIWEADAKTGRRTQLTATSRSHWRPWCAPDGRSILFTSDPEGGKQTLYRFDRITKRESPSAKLHESVYGIVDTIDDSRVIVQEHGGTIEIIDIRKDRTIRQISGVNAVLAPNRALMAWQSAVNTVLHPDQRSHILVSDVNGSGLLDLGEGAAPAFLPDSSNLVFVRFDKESGRLDFVRYNIASQQQEVKATAAPDLSDTYDLTISPDGATIMLSGCCGRYGSEVYWRLISGREWSLVDDNLGGWGGWSRNGRLIYATDGRDLRPLDAKRDVWVGDIKLFDSVTGRARAILQGVSLNDDPRWCGTGSAR